MISIYQVLFSFISKITYVEADSKAIKMPIFNIYFPSIPFVIQVREFTSVCSTLCLVKKHENICIPMCVLNSIGCCGF